MRHIRILGACLVAVFALAAVAATGASAAEPEWGHCIAQKKGNYTDGNCTKFGEKKGKAVEHKGSFEWIPGATACYPMKKGNYTDSGCTKMGEKKGKPVEHKGSFEKTAGGKFTGASTPSPKPLLTTVLRTCEHEGKETPERECEGPGLIHGGEGTEYTAEVECSGEHATGEAVSGNQVANIHVVFNGCTFLGALQCSNTANEGEIAVNTLNGKLGYINKAKKEVGVVLNPATSHAPFAAFNCGSEGEEGFVIRTVVGEAGSTAPFSCSEYPSCGGDGIISPITPVDVMTPTFTQEYKEEEVNREHTHADGSEGDEIFNVPSHLEGGPLEVLEAFQEGVEDHVVVAGSAWSDAGQVVTNVNKVEGNAEIKG